MLTARQKILVILGPTATGKSDLAVRLAKKMNGEVVSADSRQVYRGLNIGTGKITKREMKGVRHHLLDVTDPKKRFTVVNFVEKGRRAIADIARRGRLPIVCGGTGFYISALLGEQTFSDVPPNEKLRMQLSKKSATELFKLLRKLNPKRARTVDRYNPRRLIRAIEIAKGSALLRKIGRNGDTLTKPGRLSLMYRDNILKIGLKLPPEELKRRIRARRVARMRRGLIAEAKRLHAHGLSWKRMDELGLEYRYLSRFLRQFPRESALSPHWSAFQAKLESEIWHYARRQMTWFRLDKRIKWFSPKENRRILKLAEKLTLGR